MKDGGQQRWISKRRVKRRKNQRTGHQSAESEQPLCKMFYAEKVGRKGGKGKTRGAGRKA